MFTKKSDRQIRDHKVLAAIGKYFAKRTVIVNGVTQTGKTLQAVFQRALDTATALEAVRASAHSALKEQRDAEAEATAIYEALKAIVAIAAGDESTEYSEFGFAPRRAAKRSAEAKAQAVLKRRATREARHTMGSHEKAHIHGAPVTNGGIVASCIHTPRAHFWTNAPQHPGGALWIAARGSEPRARRACGSGAKQTKPTSTRVSLSCTGRKRSPRPRRDTRRLQQC